MARTPSSISQRRPGRLNGVRIEHAENQLQLALVAAAFRAYAASLPIDLAYQDFDAEVAELPGSYSPPRGCLLLARDERGDALGCVALRPFKDPHACEMKRLFTFPSARGRGLGRRLAESVISEARKLGYSEIRLDTLPTMKPALAMYRQLGFSDIEAYYGPTPAGTVFMALAL